MSSSGSSGYSGQCFCGAVRIEAKGAPFAMGYCHCGDCRAWAAAPVNAFTLWNAGSVQVTAGAEHLATYKKTDQSHRKYCEKCGGHVMTDHPGGGFVDVYAAVLPKLAFEPQLHLHYGSTVLRIADGLPKYLDLPAQFGGSGTEVDE